jgi:hypothetical protein
MAEDMNYAEDEMIGDDVYNNQNVRSNHDGNANFYEEE